MQRGAQAERDRGLARGLVRGRDEQAVHRGLQAFAAAKSSCGMKSKHAHADHGEQEGRTQAADAEQEFGQRRRVARDRAVAEACC